MSYKFSVDTWELPPKNPWLSLLVCMFVRCFEVVLNQLLGKVWKVERFIYKRFVLYAHVGHQSIF